MYSSIVRYSKQREDAMLVIQITDIVCFFCIWFVGIILHLYSIEYYVAAAPLVCMYIIGLDYVNLLTFCLSLYINFLHIYI